MKKLKILMNAINEVEEENQEEEFDEASDFYAELKEAAWNILHENPGTDFGDWQMMLIEQYPTEVVDALGTNPPEVFAELSDWWDCMDYDDGVLEIPTRSGNGQSISPPNVPWNYTTYLLKRSANKAF